MCNIIDSVCIHDYVIICGFTHVHMYFHIFWGVPTLQVWRWIRPVGSSSGREATHRTIYSHLIIEEMQILWWNWLYQVHSLKVIKRWFLSSLYRNMLSVALHITVTYTFLLISLICEFKMSSICAASIIAVLNDDSSVQWPILVNHNSFLGRKKKTQHTQEWKAAIFL